MIRLLPVDEALAQRATTVGTSARFRGGDALYVAVAQLLAIPLVTWDDELLKRAVTLVTVRRPTA